MSEFHAELRHFSELRVFGDQRLHDWREGLRLQVPGHEFAPAFKRRQWDGTWAPGNCLHVSLPQYEYELRCSRGLYPKLATELGLAIDWLYPAPEGLDEFIDTHPQMGQLRDYQLDAWREVLTCGWGRIAFATNAGKGAVIALLAAYAAATKRRALICCDEIAVYDALQGELAQWGKMRVVGVKAGAIDPPKGSAVTLAMVPTLARRLNDPDTKDEWKKWLLSQDMLLLDEADKALSDTWQSIIKTCANTVWRAGFSGTFSSQPYQSLRAEESMGPVLRRVRNSELVHDGISAKPSVEVHPFEATSALYPFPSLWFDETPTGRRNIVYERCVVHNVERHQFVAARIRPGIPTVIVVNRVEHGVEMAQAIAGAEFLSGSDSSGVRLDTLERFQAGKFSVLVTTKILDRGTNRLGSAVDLVFASGEGSQTQTLQRIGRGLRRAGGKQFLRLVDIVDRVETSNKLLEMAGGYLHSAVKRRLQVYADEGFDVTICR